MLVAVVCGGGKYFRIILSRTPWLGLACTDGIKVRAEGGRTGGYITALLFSKHLLLHFI